MVRKYSEFINYPISLYSSHEEQREVPADESHESDPPVTIERESDRELENDEEIIGEKGEFEIISEEE